MTKHGLLIRRTSELDQDQFGEQLVSMVDDVSGDDRILRAAVDVMESSSDLRSANGLRSDAVAPDAIVWLDLIGQRVEADEFSALVSASGDVMATLVSEPYLAWDELSTDEGGGRSPGVKQTSLLFAAPGTAVDEFRAAYRAHQALTRVHMPGVARYVQNDVLESDDADMIALSELWFGSSEDFRTRYWATPESPEEFRSHETFLDLPRACSVVGYEHVGGSKDRGDKSTNERESFK